MGMGHAAAFADVISEEKLKELCPLEFEDFMEVCNENGAWCGIERIAGDLQCGDCEDKSITTAYDKLLESFNKKTGLTLYIGYHDSNDNGDRYDEVDGVYWGVDGMYVLSEAGKKIGSMVERKSFVMFG